MDFLNPSTFKLLNNLLNRSADEEPRRDGSGDRRIAPCSVDLYIRPVDGSGGIIGEHWVLYFNWDFYDESYEAGADENGILTPSNYEGKPEGAGQKHYRIKRIINKRRVSPEKVKEIADGNKYTGKQYSIMNASCQDWARELGKDLGLKMPDSQVMKAPDTAGDFASMILGRPQAPVIRMIAEGLQYKLVENKDDD